MQIVMDMFEILLEIAKQVIGILIETFGGIVPIFYVSAPEGPGTWTIYGVLLLFSLGFMFATYGFNFLRNLIHK